MSKKSASRMTSFQHAFAGLVSAFRSEPNLKIHSLALVLVIGAGWHFDISRGEWMAAVLAAGLVITTEILNTSIETLTDLVSPGHHDLAGKTKDLAAAAVLTASMTATATGLVIFGPKVAAMVSAF